MRTAYAHPRTAGPAVLPAARFRIVPNSAIGADFLLHKIDLYWIGRYLGIVGSALIAVSFVYSLRKRKIVPGGSLKRWLELHEYLSWAGALMILVHAGVHFNALLPWAAVMLLLIAVASGFTGKYLLRAVRGGRVEERRMRMIERRGGGASANVTKSRKVRRQPPAWTSRRLNQD